MDEYADIYFLDEDDDELRNAVRDQRARRSPFRTAARARLIRQPSSAGLVRASRTQVARPVAVMQPASGGGFSLGNLTGTEVVELAAKILAAIQPLPAAPVATGKAEDDVANLITYQGALAVHAKRDEQLRTLGDLVARALS